MDENIEMAKILLNNPFTEVKKIKSSQDQNPIITQARSSSTFMKAEDIDHTQTKTQENGEFDAPAELNEIMMPRSSLKKQINLDERNNTINHTVTDDQRLLSYDESEEAQNNNDFFENFRLVFKDEPETIKQIKEDIQLCMLQSLNDSNQNALHESCIMGSDSLIQIILEVTDELSLNLKGREICETLRKSKSYDLEKPKNPNVFLGILQQVDDIGYVPFFYLCERGVKLCGKCKRVFNLDNDDCQICLIKSNGFHNAIKLIIQKVTVSEKTPQHGVTKKKNDTHWADFNFKHENTNQTALHWLAFANDYKSIAYILQKIQFEFSYESWVQIMQKTKFKKFTPLCIAGKKKHGKVLDEFFKFFKKNNYIIKTIFDKDGPKKKKILDEFPQLYSEEVLDKKIELKNVDGKGFNNVQQLYLNLYYWAACYGDFEIVNIFLIDLGFSPFMKISSEQTPVHGAVLHLQERIFCYFVKNSSHGLPPVHKNVYESSKCSLDDLTKNKYQCLNEKAWQTFAESRQSQNENGNNIIHFIFTFSGIDKELRNRYLQMCVDEHVGSLTQRNLSNYLPHQIQHVQPINDIPKELEPYYFDVFQEAEEADYQIVIQERNLQIIKQLIKQCGLLQTTNFYRIKEASSGLPFMGNKDDPNKNLVVISIQVPSSMIDERAQMDSTVADLTYIQKGFITKAKFNCDLIDDYCMFDSRERISTISSILSQQIDFEYYVKQGVILEHYPLHKRNPKDIEDEFWRTYVKLMWNFVWTDDWYKHFTAINFVKSYYGEKYAFQFAFLIHYQAWLFMPALSGLILTIYQCTELYRGVAIASVIDNKLNGLYGLFLSVWSTIFIQSWKKKQKLIKFYWDIDHDDIVKDDERTSQFKYNLIFNQVTLEKQKTQMVPKPMLRIKYGFIGRFILFSVLCICATYVVLDGSLKEKKVEYNADVIANPDKYPSTFEQKKYDIYVGLNSGIYSLLIVILGLIHQKLVIKLTDTDNHQFQTQYDNSLITKYFIFNFLNFYVPLLLIAVLYTLFTFKDVYILILSQMVVKQIQANLIAYYKPKIATSKKLTNLKRIFKDIIYEEMEPEEFQALQKNQHQGLDLIPENLMIPQKNQIQVIHGEKSELDYGKSMENIDSTYQFSHDYQGPKSRRRFYQSIRDFSLFRETPIVLENYMELVVQFGYVVLFGQLFPLGSLFSIFANRIQMKIQIQNLAITRRFKPQVSDGIGNWINTLEVMSTLSVFFNILFIYFTSTTYQEIFTGETIDDSKTAEFLQETGQVTEAKKSLEMDAVKFFMLLVACEHFIIMIQLATQKSQTSEPQLIIQGSADRKFILNQHLLKLQKSSQPKDGMTQEAQDEQFVAKNLPLIEAAQKRIEQRVTKMKKESGHDEWL